MELALGLYVGGLGFIWRVKGTQVDVLPIDVDLRKKVPSALWGELHSKNSSAAALVGSTLILSISLPRKIAQIVYAVVIAHAVAMIDFMKRPNAVSVKPSKAMRTVHEAIELYRKITVFVFAGAGKTANFAGVIGSTPSEKTRQRIVIKAVAQLICGKIVFSHKAPELLVDQKPKAMWCRLSASSF